MERVARSLSTELPCYTDNAGGSGRRTGYWYFPATYTRRAVPWKKTPPELIAAFDRAKPRDPRVQRKLMFGYPALFVNRNMFAGTYQERVVVRLPEAERAKLRWSAFEPMPGRPMKEYLVVPASIVAKTTELSSWLERALTYAAELPPKRGRR